MYRKELTYYFSTPVAYIVIALFLVGVSLFLWVIPGEWNILESGYAQIDGLFAIAPWLLILLCPALAMRLFAEERTSGTWDLLVVNQNGAIGRIVWAKYAASLTVVILSLLPTIVHYFIVYAIAEPVGNVDGGAFAGSFIGLLLLAAALLAVSVLAAAVTTNQLVAFMLGALSCFILYWTVLQQRFESMARGVVDLKDVMFLLSVALLAVALATPLLHRLTKL